MKEIQTIPLLPIPTHSEDRRDFQVIADGGLDKYEGLLNDVPVAPFTINFGDQTLKAGDLPREEFFERIRRGSPHPTTAQPTPQAFAELYQQAGKQAVLCVNISPGLSGSLNAAEQARSLVPEADVTLHSSQSLSAAQAFQVHAAMSARKLGETLGTARKWMQQVGEETELYFTVETLEYLKRGGRIGKVAAMLGGLLNLKPVVSVDKASGTYINIARARSWKSAIEAVAAQVTARYGAGTPLRLGLLIGEDRQAAETLLEILRSRHPIVWSGFAPVNPVLSVHTGPGAVGVAAAPGAWPWER